MLSFHWHRINVMKWIWKNFLGNVWLFLKLWDKQDHTRKQTENKLANMKMTWQRVDPPKMICFLSQGSRRHLTKIRKRSAWCLQSKASLQKLMHSSCSVAWKEFQLTERLFLTKAASLFFFLIANANFIVTSELCHSDKFMCSVCVCICFFPVQKWWVKHFSNKAIQHTNPVKIQVVFRRSEFSVDIFAFNDETTSITEYLQCLVLRDMVYFCTTVTPSKLD